MTGIAIDPASPIFAFDPNFLQHFFERVLPSLSPPGLLDPEKQQAHDRAALYFLESVKPASPLELILAGHIAIAHHAAADYDQMAMECVPASRDETRLHAAAAGQTRLMFQAVRILLASQARTRPAGRNNPMQSGDDAPASAGQALGRHDDPMQREAPAEHPANQPPAPQANVVRLERNHPMPSGDDAAAATAEPPQPLVINIVQPERPAPKRFRIEDHVKHEALRRPDGTRWGGPPACWPGPSWLAHRFPLTDAERRKEWGPKAWDELTMEQKLAAWGYGVTAADYAAAAAARAAEETPHA